MPSFDHLPYRPCVGALLLNREGQVFVGQRIDRTSEAWQMPQGGIDPGETPREALFRELSEEIGTRDVDILGESQSWLSYDLPAALISKLWGGKYRGQRQKWFAARFLGTDGDIRLDTEHPEFSAWQWVAPEDLPRLIVPFKRKLYQDVMEEFKGLL